MAADARPPRPPHSREHVTEGIVLAWAHPRPRCMAESRRLSLAPGRRRTLPVQPVFADPKTDFVFKRIFGSEGRKPLLIALLNHMLELEGDRRILDVQHL